MQVEEEKKPDRDALLRLHERGAQAEADDSLQYETVPEEECIVKSRMNRRQKKRRSELSRL